MIFAESQASDKFRLLVQRFALQLVVVGLDLDERAEETRYISESQLSKLRGLRSFRLERHQKAAGLRVQSGSN
jgi:hypothetical protein